jgi:hypothetical protein
MYFLKGVNTFHFYIPFRRHRALYTYNVLRTRQAINQHRKNER